MGGGGNLFTTLKGRYLLGSFRLTTGCVWGEDVSTLLCIDSKRSEMRGIIKNKEINKSDVNNNHAGAPGGVTLCEVSWRWQ